MQELSCALRALNLCDGIQLEQSDRTLTQCPHEVLSRADLYRTHQRAEQVLSEAMDALQPPLFGRF